MKIALRLAALLFTTGVVFGAPVDVTVGRVGIAIPEPEGMVALRVADAPYYKLNVLTQQNLGNRLLASYLPPSQAKVADSGSIPTAPEWAFALALPREGIPVSTQVFRDEFLPVIEKALASALTDPATRAKSNSGVAQGVEGVKKEFGLKGKPDMDVGQLIPLGTFSRTDRYFAYGAKTNLELTELSGKRTAVPIVMAIVVTNLRDRIFQLALYRRIESDQDITVARTKAIAWAEATVRANP